MYEGRELLWVVDLLEILPLGTLARTHVQQSGHSSEYGARRSGHSSEYRARSVYPLIKTIFRVLKVEQVGRTKTVYQVSDLQVSSSENAR